jgi:hypothetical protein
MKNLTLTVIVSAFSASQRRITSKAVETHNISALPIAANVRITENAAEVKPGEGFLKTIVDASRCSALTQAVVEESVNGTAGLALVAVRLKLDAGKVSEIETVIAQGRLRLQTRGRARNQKPGLDNFTPRRGTEVA